ncbi:uncharacterized protein LOC143890530 [Tasmannia lanceolata]|uniref:uncharacterized protein LOC143890530 n=1 Tax=Tasmannia lanceolata TaxID=3420 RepID=UPI0040628521
MAEGALAGNSYRIAVVSERLGLYLRNGVRSESGDVFNLCISLARSIDYAVTYNEVPTKVHDLPSLIKQVYQRKNDVFLQSAIMLLMISVKNACRNGWFQATDTDELLTLTNEISSNFCSTENIAVEPSNALHIISTIMPRFYPRMKMGHIIVSLEAKPGYEFLVADFYIPKSISLAVQERIRLFVARKDYIETSSCIISPPDVSFVLNGNGVERRTTVSPDNGPQFPTDVTTMLKFGTNLMQAVGNFNGNYIIVIAYMSVISASETTVLQDYVQPAASSLASDAEIVEGPSRISLNCPISYKRMVTPVKGHLCRHHQCFDYDNFMEINSRKPSWRCPHCNQPTSCTDIRIDQNMVKVLREVGEDVVDVFISADGSWRIAAELDSHADHHHNGSLPGKERDDGLEQQCESNKKAQNIQAGVVDLTMEETDTPGNLTSNAAGGATETSVCPIINQVHADIIETEDRKPFQDILLQGFSGTENLIESSSIVNSASDTLQEGAYQQIGPDFWSRMLSLTSHSNGSPGPTISRTDDAHIQTSFPVGGGMLAPVLTDAVPPAVNREPMNNGHGMTQQPTISFPQVGQFVATESYMQLQQQPRFGNSIVSSETGRPSIPRHITRNPIAVQALPAQTQVPNPHHQRPRTTSALNPNPMISSGAMPIGSQPTTSMTPVPDGFNSNWDRQDRHYAPNQALQQVVGLPATSQVGTQMPSVQQRAGAYRGASLGIPLDHQNIHHHQGPPTNLRATQSVNQPANLLQQSCHYPPSMQQQVQQPAQSGIGLAAAANRLMVPQHTSQMTRSSGAPTVQMQAPRTVVSSFPMSSSGDSLRLPPPIGDYHEIHNLVSFIGGDSLPELPSEHNWRPTGRMRGSLTGRAFSAGLTQFMVQPTPPPAAAQVVRPPPPPPPLDVLIANNINAHGQPQSYIRTGDAGCQGSLGIRPP